MSVLHFDAHGDLRDEYEGQKNSHACAAHRWVELGIPSVHVGIRSISKEEVDYVRKTETLIVSNREIHASEAWMDKALRKLTGTIAKSRTIVVFINQIRMKIGVMFGNPETTTGGNALKFYASVRLDIRRIGALKHGEDVIGNRTKVKIVKNKVAPPFREAEFDVMYGEGISKEGDLLDLAVERKIVDKSGTWFSYSGERLGQGRENVKQFLRDNPATYQAIDERLRKELGLAPAIAEPVAG